MNAFDIEINDEFIDLPNTALRYEAVNSLFTTAIYQGDYSFPFEIPATEKNLRLFNFVNSVDVTSKITQIENVYLYVFGLPKFRTKLTVTEVSNTTIFIQLNGGIKALSNANKTLKELLSTKHYRLGNTQAEILVTAKQAAEEGNWQTYGFTFVPFYAPNFYDGKNSFFLNVCNRVNSTNGDFLSNSKSVVNNKYNLVPFLFLFEILNEIFKDAGLSCTGSFWENEEFAKLLLFSNRAIEIRPTDFNTYVRKQGSVNYTYTGQRIQFSINEDETYDNLNAWDSTNNEYTIKAAGQFDFDFEYQQSVENSGTFPLVQENWKGGTLVMFLDGSEIHSRKMDDSGSLSREYFTENNLSFGPGDIGKKIHYEYRRNGSSWQATVYNELSNLHLRVTFRPSDTEASLPYNVLEFKNHVPEKITVSEFLTEVKRLGINFSFDSIGFVKIDGAEEILNDPKTIDLTENAARNYRVNYEDKRVGTTLGYVFNTDEKSELEIDPEFLLAEVFSFEDLPGPTREGNHIVVTNTNQIYKTIKTGILQLEWELAGSNYKPFKIGNGQEELLCKLAPMQMCLAENEGGTAEQNTALMPSFLGKGSSDLFGLGINEVEMRLVFWRGKNQMGNLEVPKGGNYVLASTCRYGINQNTVGKYSFRLDETTGILRANTEQLLNIIDKSEIMEKDFYFDTKKLEQVKATSKVLVDFNLFIIKNLSITISKKLVQVKAYLYKM